MSNPEEDRAQMLKLFKYEEWNFWNVIGKTKTENLTSIAMAALSAKTPLAPLIIITKFLEIHNEAVYNLLNRRDKFIQELASQASTLCGNDDALTAFEAGVLHRSACSELLSTYCTASESKKQTIIVNLTKSGFIDLVTKFSRPGHDLTEEDRAKLKSAHRKYVDGESSMNIEIRIRSADSDTHSKYHKTAATIALFTDFAFGELAHASGLSDMVCEPVLVGMDVSGLTHKYAHYVIKQVLQARNTKGSSVALHVEPGVV